MENAWFEDAINRPAPTKPPASVQSVSRISNPRSKARSSLANPNVPDKYPGNTATALVALAATGGRPAKTSAGKVRKLPPPAIVFKTPAANAAKINTIHSNIDAVLLKIWRTVR